jgi:hypothetical protein
METENYTAARFPLNALRWPLKAEGQFPSQLREKQSGSRWII